MRAALLLPMIGMSLRWRGFRATRRFLQACLGSRTGPGGAASAGAEEGLAAIARWTSRMVLAAARHSLFPSSCLERSLALWWLLGRRGIGVQLRIGVRKSGEKFEAHAWVERAGVAIGEPEATHRHYAAFAEEFTEELP